MAAAGETRGFSPGITHLENLCRAVDGYLWDTRKAIERIAEHAKGPACVLSMERLGGRCLMPPAVGVCSEARVEVTRVMCYFISKPLWPCERLAF
jgi:hypothetical protein